MNRNIIVTGATGLIGRNISNALIKNNENVIVFSRRPEEAKKIIKGATSYVFWDYENSNWKKYLNKADAVINLAGENIASKRWTKKVKRKIYDSRILSTRALVNAIIETGNKPECFISASAVGFYGNREDEVDEYSDKGNGFLASLVNDWENESKRLEDYNVRVVSIRLGTVLSKEGGALQKLIKQFNYYLGGTIAGGNQWFPWIHIDDAVGIFLMALNNPEIKGVLNGVSPTQVKQKEFVSILSKYLNKPCYLNIPAFLLRFILGELALVLLEGARVIPRRTLEYGYKFKYEDIDESLSNLLT